jgi:hypothetical protein
VIVQKLLEKLRRRTLLQQFVTFSQLDGHVRPLLSDTCMTGISGRVFDLRERFSRAREQGDSRRRCSTARGDCPEAPVWVARWSRGSERVERLASNACGFAPAFILAPARSRKRSGPR